MRELRPHLVNIGESSSLVGLAVRSMSSSGKQVDRKHVLFGTSQQKVSCTQATRNRRILLVISKGTYPRIVTRSTHEKPTDEGTADKEE
jgi:hypothetical protein